MSFFDSIVVRNIQDGIYVVSHTSLSIITSHPAFINNGLIKVPNMLKFRQYSKDKELEPHFMTEIKENIHPEL